MFNLVDRNYMDYLDLQIKLDDLYVDTTGRLFIFPQTFLKNIPD